MKTLTKIIGIIIIVSLSPIIALSQYARFNDVDTSVIYLNNKFKTGQEVQLNYGSGAGKSFSFVLVKHLNNLNKGPIFHIRGDKLPAKDAKLTFILTSVGIDIENGDCVLIGKATWTDKPDDEIWISDVNDVIDKKEIIAPHNFLISTPKNQ